MDNKSVELINSSWKLIIKHQQLMLTFYEHLFNKAPEIKYMFPSDLTRQSEKLAYTIGFVVGNVHRIDEIIASIEEVGRFHNKFDIQEKHYDLVRETLIETIMEGLGNKYTDEIGLAWNLVLTRVSTIMINAS